MLYSAGYLTVSAVLMFMAVENKGGKKSNETRWIQALLAILVAGLAL